MIYVEEVVGDTIYYTESGTSMWKRGNAGILKKRSRYNFLNKCDSGGKYVGTVVFSPIGSSPASNNTSYTPPTIPSASKPSISVTDYPTTLNQGSSYGLRGSISANGAKTTVTTSVINSSGKTMLSASDTIGAGSSGNIRYMNANNNINFSKLGGGTYTLKISAKNSAGTTNWEKGFTVKGKSAPSSTVTQPRSTLTVNLTSYPTSIAKGKSYGLRGSVTSNYKITSVKGYIINSSGKTVQSTTDTPNATSMDIRYSNVNNNLIFNKLAKGTYTLKVVAYDAYGASNTWQRNFTVK